MSCSKRKKKILFVIYSDPMIYPPTMNAANILAENNWMVDVIGIKYQTNERIKPSTGVNLIYFDCHRTGLGLRLQFLLFCLWCSIISIGRRYDWVFSYDMSAVVPGKLSSIFSRACWCYHNHDLMESELAKGFFNRWLKKAELKFVRKADLVIFPQADRAKLFASEADLKFDPILVFNAPRKKWAIAQNPHPELQRLKQKFKKIALYQGGLSSHFQLEKLLAALPLCRSEFGLCIVGKELEQGIREKFIEQAEQLGVKERIIVLPVVSYDELPSITAFCDIGIAKFSVENSGSINDFLLAGASNKLAEYMAFGLPILAPDTDSNRHFIEDAGHGLVCKVTPKSIANCLDRLNADESLYDKIKENNISYFNDCLNYDIQFDKVLEVISMSQDCI